MPITKLGHELTKNASNPSAIGNAGLNIARSLATNGAQPKPNFRRLLDLAGRGAKRTGKFTGNILKQTGHYAIKGMQHAGKATVKGVSKATKGVNDANTWVSKKLVIPRYTIPSAAVLTAGSLSLPEHIRASMVHVNPDSENFTVDNYKGYTFANPQLKQIADNTNLIF